MRRAALLLAIWISLVVSSAQAGDDPKPVRAKFELLGMLRECALRNPDGDTFEEFKAKDVDGMTRFEELLGKFCEQEKIPPGYEKRPTDDGESIDYLSPKIAHAIDEYCRILTRDDSLFADASNEELLSYIAGAYRRFGKGYIGSDAKMHPIYFRKKSLGDLRTIGRVLARLGCGDIYIDGLWTNLDYTIYSMTFGPSWKFEKAFGPVPQSTVDDLGEVHSHGGWGVEQIPSVWTRAQYDEDHRQRIEERKKEPPVWKVNLSAKPEPFLLGQPMHLEIRITNVCQKPATLVLLRRQFSYDITVADAQGKQLRFTPEGSRFFGESTMDSSEDRIVQPSDGDVRTVDLSKLFEIAAPGKYRVTVKYRYYEPPVGASMDVTVE